MAPRAYTLRNRATSSASTRARILDAAKGLYRERGVGSTTMAAIAERADVSRGTILHHFGGNNGLLEAVADDVLQELALPDDAILDGIDDPEQRVRIFVGAMVRFFERSTPWWTVFESQMDRPALKARQDGYEVTLAGLQAAALGPEAAGDAPTTAAIGGLIHPGTLGSYLWLLEGWGFGEAERIRIIGDLVVGYLAHRARTTRPG